MSVLERMRDWFLAPLLEEKSERRALTERARSYRQGVQARQIRTKIGYPDDNLVVNFISLVVDRAVSMLVGYGVEFDMDDEARAEYIDQVWDANREEQLLHRLALLGAESGTCYVKIIPDGIVSRVTGQPLPRLIAIDPAWMTIDTSPEDWEQVIRYTIKYTVTGLDGREMARKEVIEQDGDTGMWVVTDYQAGVMTQGQWQQTDQQPWPYEFAPMLHWQNLPSVSSSYGQPDITDDLIALQDRINFIAGNISKIIRFAAHPVRIGKGVGSADTLEMGVDKMLRIGKDADIYNLEMQGDLASSQAYLQYLQRELFAISRTVDLDSLTDKMGQLTNFGLRVLYTDALAKLGTKRELYGDALVELNYRILRLAGYTGAQADGGKVIWPDILPVNEAEQLQAAKTKLELGVASKETVSTELGYDYESERERMSADQAESGNIGAALLRAFNGGQQ